MLLYPRGPSSRIKSTLGLPRRWPPKSASAAESGAHAHGARNSRWTSSALVVDQDQEPHGSTDSWRAHHDAVAHFIYRGTLRAGIEWQTEVRGLFPSLLPPADRPREARDGLIPDALLRRPTEHDAFYKDHLHDMKMIHMSPFTYRDANVKEKGVPRNADAQADKVHAQHVAKAQSRPGMLLIGARGGTAHLPEAQIVPRSPGAMRGHLRGMQLRHPSAATGGGKVRGHAPLASSWSCIRGGGCRDLLGQVQPPLRS